MVAAADVTGSAPIPIDLSRIIGDQASSGDEETFVVYRGQLVPGRQRNDKIAMTLRCPTRRHDQAAVRRARESRDGAFYLCGIAHVNRVNLHPKRRRYCLDDGELARSGAQRGVPENCRACHAWRDLFEPGEVAVRTAQVGDEPPAERDRCRW